MKFDVLEAGMVSTALTIWQVLVVKVNVPLQREAKLIDINLVVNMSHASEREEV